MASRAASLFESPDETLNVRDMFTSRCQIETVYEQLVSEATETIVDMKVVHNKTTVWVYVEDLSKRR